MKVIVQLFAGARELVGVEEVDVELASHSTVADLRRALLANYPTLEIIVPHALFAINATYATDESEIPDNAEVALIPPVSGG